MMGMLALTSVVEERVRMAEGEDDDVSAVWAHGGADVPAMLRRRRREHRVGEVAAMPMVRSGWPGKA